MRENRDNFTEKTRRLLAGRVGYRCCICGALTIGPQEGRVEIHLLGIGAHITAAAPNGPRYDKNLDSDQRKSYENGIWCCLPCGTIVDNDLSRWTVEQLRQYKDEAERLAAKNIGIKALQDFPPRLELVSEFLADVSQLPDHHYVIEVRFALRNAGGSIAKGFTFQIRTGKFFKWHPFDLGGFNEYRIQRVQRGTDSQDGFDVFQDDERQLPSDVQVHFIRFKALLTLNDIEEQDIIAYRIHCNAAVPLNGEITINFSKLIQQTNIISPEDLRKRIASGR